MGPIKTAYIKVKIMKESFKIITTIILYSKVKIMIAQLSSIIVMMIIIVIVVIIITIVIIAVVIIVKETLKHQRH